MKTKNDMEKKKQQSCCSRVKLTVALMFTGMLMGLFLHLYQTKETKKPSVGILQTLKQSIYMDTTGTRKLDGFMAAWKARIVLKQLIQKDTLGQQDSIDIKTIDNQLDQLIHD